jgi:hypothetical protein
MGENRPWRIHWNCGATNAHSLLKEQKTRNLSVIQELLDLSPALDDKRHGWYSHGTQDDSKKGGVDLDGGLCRIMRVNGIMWPGLPNKVFASRTSH